MFLAGKLTRTIQEHQQNLVMTSANVSLIGAGAYAKVYKLYDEGLGSRVAVKLIPFESDQEGIPCTALREISTLLTLKHPNIVQLLKVHHNLKFLVLTFEFCESDLSIPIRSQKISFHDATRFAFQIITAVSFIHSRSIIHRDIKPENILLTKEKVVKLADFGLAYMDNSLPGGDISFEVVTLWYRAPEILQERRYSCSSDMWSVGCVIAEMLLFRPLFPGKDETDQLVIIQRVMKQGIGQILSGFDTRIVELVEGLLELDPEKRLTAKQALASPLFQGLYFLPLANFVHDSDKCH